MWWERAGKSSITFWMTGRFGAAAAELVDASSLSSTIGRDRPGAYGRPRSASCIMLSYLISGMRMRFITISAMALFCSSGHSAVAAETACKTTANLGAEELMRCTCGNGVARLPMSAPPGMKLVASCGQKHESGEWHGGFYFAGSYVQSGTVTREFNHVLGDTLSFAGEKSVPYQQFLSEAQLLKFWDDPTAIKKFRAPRPTQRNGCWSARAKIEVQILYVLTGGTDEAGSYPRKYRVLNLGKYRPCA